MRTKVSAAVLCAVCMAAPATASPQQFLSRLKELTSQSRVGGALTPLARSDLDWLALPLCTATSAYGRLMYVTDGTMAAIGYKGETEQVHVDAALHGGSNPDLKQLGGYIGGGVGTPPELFVSFAPALGAGSAAGRAAVLTIKRIRRGRVLDSQQVPVQVRCRTSPQPLAENAALKLQKVTGADFGKEILVDHCSLSAGGVPLFLSAIDVDRRRRAIVKFNGRPVRMFVTAKANVYATKDRATTAVVEYAKNKVRHVGEDGVVFPAKLQVDSLGGRVAVAVLANCYAEDFNSVAVGGGD